MKLLHDNTGCESHIDLEVGVQQHLEVERLLALVANVQHGLQTVFAQRDGVDKAELVWPCLLVLFRKVCSAETKVELHRIVAALGQGA